MLLTRKEAISLAGNRVIKAYSVWFVFSEVVIVVLITAMTILLIGKVNALHLVLMLIFVPVLPLLTFWWVKLNPIYKKLKGELTAEWGEPQ